VQNISHYILNLGGKKLRPILMLLVNKICGAKNDNIFFLSAAVELIHVATLLHDDVVDESLMRRSAPTANFNWGNKASILVGDFLFATAFKLMVKADSIQSLKELANASTVITEGEVMQLSKIYENKILSLDSYEKIANCKTGALFGASAHVGAIISDSDFNIRNAAKSYGQYIGLIFQAVDDMLDYFADSNDTGKNIGDDLSQGNVTLPIILCYNNATDADKAILESYFFTGLNRGSKINQVIELLNKYDTKTFVLQYIKNLQNNALECLKVLPSDNEYHHYLVELIEYIVNRKS
jgi:octaprenyl-diphosphate synthase